MKCCDRSITRVAFGRDVLAFTQNEDHAKMTKLQIQKSRNSHSVYERTASITQRNVPYWQLKEMHDVAMFRAAYVRLTASEIAVLADKSAEQQITKKGVGVVSDA